MVYRSREDLERKAQARKRKKWKENLSVHFTDEEYLSSESDAQTKATCSIESIEAIALRFPYPMISDDSDNDEDLNYHPRPSENMNHANKCKSIILSSNENIELSTTNKSYKHKKRKLNSQENSKSTKMQDVKEVKSAKSCNVTRSKKITSKKNTSHDSAHNKCENTSLLKIESPTIVKVVEKCGSSGHSTNDNNRQVSKTTQDVKRTALNTRNKVHKNYNSRFLHSSSEEEVVGKPFRGHNRFKRINVLSTSSSSSENEVSENNVKKQRICILTTSPNSIDDGKENELIANERNEHQTQKPALDMTRIKCGLRQSNNFHSISSSDDSEDNTDNTVVPTKHVLKNEVSSRKTPPLFLSSQQSSSKLLVSNDNKIASKNPNYVKFGDESKSNLNTDAWKNIANVKIKQPTPKSSMHQSYLQTLKRQSMTSNSTPDESNKKIIDKTYDKRVNVKFSNEMYSKSKVSKENSTLRERQTGYHQKLPSETSISDIIHDNQQPLDLNINMNVQIICSPSLVENTNSVGNSISKSPAENNHKAAPPELDINLSLTHQENRNTKVSSYKKMKSSSTSERRKSASNSKYNDSNKINDKTQNKLTTKYSKTNQSDLKKEDTLQNEKKGLNIQSRKNILIENSDSGHDLLSNILFEMDNNQYKVEKVFPKKALEPYAEMLVPSSSTSDLHSTPPQIYFPANLQPPEKENRLTNHKCQVKNQLDFAKQTAVTVGLGDKHSSIPTTSSITKSLVHLNKNHQESKNNTNTCVKELINSEKNKTQPNIEQTLSKPTLITSFYSVNSEDYIQPHDIPITKNTESNSTLIQNTSSIVDKPQFQMLDTNSKPSLCKDIIKLPQSKTINQSMNNEKLTSKNKKPEGDKLSNSVSEASIGHDPSSSQKTLYKNHLETRDRQYLENKTSAERNLKDKDYVQCIFDELVKIQTKNKSPVTEESLISEEDKKVSLTQSSKNSNLGNTMLTSSQGSTTYWENNIINHYAESSKEEIKNPVSGTNEISNSNPSKGIRIRVNGNVYRLPGKENVIDSNAKAEKQKENIFSPTIERENKSPTNTSQNKSDKNTILSTHCTSNTESKRDKSSSSSESSSDESQSSEHELVVSENSCSESSTGSCSSEDEKEDTEIKSMKESSKISSEGEINQSDKKEVKSEKTNLNITRPCSKSSEVIEPTKSKIRTLTLDELIGFHEKNKIKSSLKPESSCNIVNDDVIMLSSSSEAESNEYINKSACKSTSIKTIDGTVSENNGENTRTKITDHGCKNQNSIENKVFKIRVKSFKELGISHAHPLPDNALPPSESVAVEYKEHSLQAQLAPQKAVDLNPTSSENNYSLTKKKSAAQPTQLKKKSSPLNKETKTVGQHLQEPPLLHNELNKPGIGTNTENLNSFNSLPSLKVNIISKEKIYCPEKHIYTTTIKKCATKPSITCPAVEVPTVYTPVLPKGGTVLALCRVPAVNQTITENITATTSSSFSISDVQQNISQAELQKTVQILNPNKSTDPKTSQNNMESNFFNLCDKLFCEVIMMKIPKMVDDLHLVITHDIMREERLKKVDQLKCPETKIEEKRRTEKEFNDMLKIRSQGFVPLFMTVVRKMEKDSMKTQVMAFYCKIIHLLDQIDPINSTYRFKLKDLIKKMLMKNNITHEVCSVFSDNITSFTSNFNFIDNLLLKYDQFVINRKRIADLKTSDENNKDATEQIISQNKNSGEGDILENTTNQVGKTTTGIVSATESPTSEQTAKTTHESNRNNLTSRPTANRRPPVANLDELLLGSFSERATSQKSLK